MHVQQEEDKGLILKTNDKKEKLTAKDHFGSIENKTDEIILEGREDLNEAVDNLDNHNERIDQMGVNVRVKQEINVPVKLEEYLKDSGTIFPCDQCIFETSTQMDLSEHKYSMHVNHEKGGKALGKTTDKKEIKRQQNLDPKKEEPCPFPCTECDFGSKHKRTLVRHINNIHKSIKRFSCDTCDFSSYFKSNVKDHGHKIHMERSFRVIGIGCEYCEKEIAHKICILSGSELKEIRAIKKKKT